MNPEKASQLILQNSQESIFLLNNFTADVFKTRGGRIGSGMGSVIEALWGFFLNSIFNKNKSGIELAWMYGHEYNDFACIKQNEAWDPETKIGEVLRVEVKSMVASADESKAHFDRLSKELSETDILTVFIWDWINDIEGKRKYPKILDYFIGKAIDLCELRDNLHIARGGMFVEKGKCPDGCTQKNCSHIGEPLNASGKRERLSGPNSARVSATVSYAANFGGMVRMLKCSSSDARKILQNICSQNDTAWEYLNFIHRNFPSEEENSYTKEEWLKVAQALKIEIISSDKKELIKKIRTIPNYRKILRKL